MSARAQLRRDARQAAKDRPIPMVPGVIPDRAEATQRNALAAAHDHLPNIPGTQVCLALFDIEAGLDAAAKLYRPEQLDLLRQRVAEVGGTDPAIVFAYRKPHGSNL